MKKILLSLSCLGLVACGNDLPEGSETISVDGVEFNMIRVEAGEFMMGATDEQKDADYFKERPVHKVVISKPYYIGETEVTQELWTAVMGSNPSKFTGGEGETDLPVVNVSYDDCQKFVKALSQKTGRTFRLPTEAEWEYAARGGEKGKYNITVYAGADKPEVAAYYKKNSENRPHKVGTMMPNELKLRDMSGNVAEWVADCYSEYKDSTYTDPCITFNGDTLQSGMIVDANWNHYKSYVIRGGHFVSDAAAIRTSARDYASQNYSQTNLGLRVVME